MHGLALCKLVDDDLLSQHDETDSDAKKTL